MEKFTYLSKAKLNNIPKAPGVYALASLKTILYIGKAVNLKERVKNHFMQPTYKDDLFVQDVKKIGYIKTQSDIDALLLESQLIKKQQPKYNVMWKDDKKYFFVAITKEDFPRVFLTHQPVELPKGAGARAKLGRGRGYGARSEGGSSRRPRPMEYIGPFTEGKAIKRVLRLLRRVFPYYTAKKHGALLCQYCHLNLCPGPPPRPEGAGEARSQSERHSFENAYKKNIRNLVSVLKGKKTFVLKQLKKEMGAAAKNQDFKKAAELRDQFFSLESIISHARLLTPEISPFVNWTVIEKDLQKLFSIKKRITRIEAYDISNIQGKEATGSQVTFVKGVPAKEHYRKYKIHITGKSNDFAMMEELLLRRLLHKEWPYPQIIVIDGGKGQLTSAINATLNVDKAKGIKIVALAKKQNELFFPGKQKSVLLRDLPMPSENLFLHIRDEAHRFAISYHRFLHRKETLGRNT